MPGMPSHDRETFNRSEFWVDFIDACRTNDVRSQDRPFLPTHAHRFGDIANFPRRMIGSHDLADAATMHHLTEANALGVIARRTHTTAHVRIDRKPLCFDQDLTESGIRHRLLIHHPILGDGGTFRIACEQPATVDKVLHDHSALTLLAAITLRHFSVSATTSLAKSEVESDSGASPSSAIRWVILLSAKARLIVLLSFSTIWTGV